jgi:hypothetical protein
LIFHFINQIIFAIVVTLARVVELVDTLALGASALGREGSSPFSRTMILFRFQKFLELLFLPSRRYHALFNVMIEA